MMKRLAVAAAIAIAACTAPSALASETEYVWSMELDCTLCHAAEAASLETADVDLEAEAPAEPVADASAVEAVELVAAPDDVNGYAVMHYQTFKMGCTDCHQESEGLEKGHKKLNSGKEATKLKKSEVGDEVCLSCHQRDKVAEATTQSELLTDERGTSVNPHALPDTEDHAKIDCTDCHQAHGGKDAAQAAMATCTSCHHERVFECNTCH